MVSYEANEKGAEADSNVYQHKLDTCHFVLGINILTDINFALLLTGYCGYHRLLYLGLLSGHDAKIGLMDTNDGLMS